MERQGETGVGTCSSARVARSRTGKLGTTDGAVSQALVMLPLAGVELL